MITRDQQLEYNHKCFNCSKVLREHQGTNTQFKETVYIVKKFDVGQYNSLVFIKFCEPCWKEICGNMYELESESYGEIEKI